MTFQGRGQQEARLRTNGIFLWYTTLFGKLFSFFMTIPLSYRMYLCMKALASRTVCSVHALLRFTSILFSVRARITNTITIPGGPSIKLVAAAVGVHVEASEIQEVVNVTVTAAPVSHGCVTCQLLTC